MIARILLAALPLLASAVPAPQPDLFSSLVKRADAVIPPALSTCDVATIKMDPAGLPPVSPGLYLEQIALGRGTQNYTCANSTSSAIPKAAGAVAVLFNVTCLAGPYTPLLNTLTSIAMKFPIPDLTVSAAPSNAFFVGHHYFANATTPFFNLNTENHAYGMVGTALLNKTDNSVDKARNVANLKLKSVSREECRVSEVYRLNVVGGQPPATCEGAPESFTVDYAAEYWFWSNPELKPYS